MKTKKNKIFLITLLIIPIFFLSACSVVNNGELNNNQLESQKNEEKMIRIDYMSDIEKENIGIDNEKKVQVLKRDDEGNIMGYKIIENDDDLVLTQTEVEELLNPVNEDENTVVEEVVEDDNILSSEEI